MKVWLVYEHEGDPCDPCGGCHIAGIFSSKERAEAVCLELKSTKYPHDEWEVKDFEVDQKLGEPFYT